MPIKDALLNLLFPAKCIVCEKYGNYLCRECFDYLPVNRTNVCPVCERQETFAGRVCNFCENGKKKIYLDGLFVASYYRQPILKTAICLLKYNFVQPLSLPLAEILLKKIFTLADFPFERFALVPVPLHAKRFSWRGFNQSELLGENLRKLLEKENLKMDCLSNLLLRHKNVKPQMKIKSMNLRKKNIAGCFSLNEKFVREIPENVILIDDVITTGATLEECAKILKNKGVQKIWGLVLARQSS